MEKSSIRDQMEVGPFRQILKPTRAKRVPHRQKTLAETWAFRLLLVALVGMNMTTLAGVLRGLIGTIVLVVVAVACAAMENSLPEILRRATDAVRANFGLFFCLGWYALGMFGKMYLTGETATDWRLVAPGIVNIAAVLFAVVFMQDERTARIFQQIFIIGMGAQSAIAVYYIVWGGVDVRAVAEESGAGWIYGDQHFFVVQAVLLPLFYWRSLVERGWRRVLLIGCSTFALWGGLVCQYGTPAGALAIGVPLFAVVGLIFARRTELDRRLALALGILIGGYLAAQVIAEHPLLANVKTRLTNVMEDPRSGGYEENQQEAGSRWKYAVVSLQSFAEHPIFGSGIGSVRYSTAVMGHSSLFDMLGFYGVLGGAGAFIGMLGIMIRRAVTRLLRRGLWEDVSLVSSLSMLIVVGIVNPYWEDLTPAMVLVFGRLFRMEE